MGSWRSGVVVCLLLLVVPNLSAVTVVNQQAKLTSGSAGDQLGSSVAIDGDTAVVGAPFDGSGTAAVFVRTGTTWTLQQTLTPTETPNQFGRSVAISGDTIVVGAAAPTLTSPGGAAYVFVRSGTTWTQQAKLVGADTVSGDSFGSDVAIDTNTIAAGAPGDDSGAGSVYVFVRSGVTWTEQQKLIASDRAAGDLLGVGVSLSGDTILAGAYQSDPAGLTNAGAAYVFVRGGTTWTETQKLISPDAAPFAQFGFDTDISGTTAIVGAGQASNAYVFTSTGGVWSFEQRLPAPAAFASAVAVDGDLAVVGSPLPTSSTGAANVFARSGTTWTLIDTITGADSAAGDRFGEAVDVDLNTVLVGAPMNDELGADAGAAYVFLIENVPGISVGDVTVTEGTGGNTPTTFTITLSEASATPITVDFATADETAISTLDYGGGTSSVTFAPGETSKFVIVSTFGDAVAENAETFLLNVTTVTGNAVVSDGSGRATIIDDDAAGVVVTPTSGLTTSESGGTATFTVVLTSQPAAPVTINLASSDTSEGTVTPTALTFTFADWNVPQTVTVTGVDDAIVDGAVAYTIVTTATSADPFYNGIAVADVAVTNADNDTGTLSINDVTVAEGGSATFTVTLSAPSASTVTVNWATVAGTATAGTDFTAGSGTITFTPGQTTQTITVATLTDATVEGNETFVVQLSGAVAATIADDQGTGTITDASIAAIPTMSQWMLIAMAMSLAAVALFVRR